MSTNMSQKSALAASWEAHPLLVAKSKAEALAKLWREHHAIVHPSMGVPGPSALHYLKGAVDKTLPSNSRPCPVYTFPTLNRDPRVDEMYRQQQVRIVYINSRL